MESLIWAVSSRFNWALMLAYLMDGIDGRILENPQIVS